MHVDIFYWFVFTTYLSEDTFLQYLFKRTGMGQKP